MKYIYKLLIYPLVKVLNCQTTSRLKFQASNLCPHTATEFGTGKYVYSPLTLEKFMLDYFRI